MTTKIHALCASEADAVDIRITAGQAGDAPVGEALIDAIDPRDGIEQAAMDKAYDSNAIRAKLDAKGITPVIPPKAKDISEKGFTTQAGRIRMSHLGRSGLRSNWASTSRIAFLDSETPFW